MRQHFNICHEDVNQDDQSKESEKVDLNNLVGSIAEDDYFQDHMNEQVRESLDGEKECLEDLLNRLLNDHKKPEISWL